MAVFTYFGVISMTNHQFATFFLGLVALGLPSVSLLFVFAWDLWHYETPKEVMGSDEIRQRLFFIWVFIALLVFVCNIHSKSFLMLTERVDALEQSGVRKAVQ